MLQGDYMKEISIGIALANTHSSVDKEQVYSFIESQKGDFEIYRLAPPRPGIILATGIDYMLLIDKVGAAASIASLLWMVYDNFIVPTKNKDDSAGIVVIIPKDNGGSDQFWIGHKEKSKKIFIETFSHKIDTIRNSELPGESTSYTNEKLRTEKIWIRRK
jgi:hypothetical protein